MKKLLTFASAIAFLAMACPSKSQTFADNETALRTRPAGALRDMVAEMLTVNTGERVSVLQGWGYALTPDTLLFCGKGYRAGRTEGFVVLMDGRNRDLVQAGATTTEMARVGCGEQGYRVIAGAPYPDPLSGLLLDPPISDFPEFRRVWMPMAWETDPDCVAGRRLAYAVAIEGNAEAAAQVPPEVLNDTTQSFGLCFVASGQEFTSARLNGMIAGSQDMTDALTARSLIQRADRMRGF